MTPAPSDPCLCSHGGRTRGTRLLLEHCARLERLTSGASASASERLERRLGRELAARLRLALCGDHALRTGFFTG